MIGTSLQTRTEWKRMKKMTWLLFKSDDVGKKGQHGGRLVDLVQIRETYANLRYPYLHSDLIA